MSPVAERLVHALYLASAEAAINVHIQSDERERQTNWLRTSGRVLRAVRVHNVLMDECWIAMRERVRQELVVGLFLLRAHGTGFVPFTTVICSDDGYSAEWCTLLCATRPSFSS